MSLFASIGEFIKKRILSHLTPKMALIAVVSVCVILLMLQYFRREDAVSPLSIAGVVVIPFQEGVNKVGSVLFKSEQDRLSLSEAKERISALEQENLELLKKLENMNQTALENTELRGLLKATEQFPEFEMEAALIIGNDGVNSFERFTINKGTADGIRTDMNVINKDGLIGIVTYTGLNYAVVTSIIEDGMNVSAMTRTGHDNCIVTGDLSHSGTGTLLLTNARSDVDRTKDGALVTSLISDRFLPGLLIGYAGDVTVNAGGLTKSGTVTTAVDFTRLSEVLVITTLREELKETEGGK